MIDWLKDLFALRSNRSYVQRIYEKMDEAKRKEGIYWKYICNNGHHWTQVEGPTSGYMSERYGLQETKCLICKSTVVNGSMYKNGVYLKAGAVHMDFGKGGQDARRSNKKSIRNSRRR